MARLLLLLMLIARIAFSSAQDQATYDQLIGAAFKLYEQKEFAASAAKYSEAFSVLGWKGQQSDRYNAACSWALAGVPDSAFFQLQRIATTADYANIGHMTRDADLNTLHADSRWEPLCQQVRANKDRLEANYDRPLVALLDSIEHEDQVLRMQVDEMETKYGRDSKEMQDFWQRMADKDSMNVIVVRKILDERGWLGPDVVGPKGNQTLFLVIQHADVNVQEQYLPMMRDAVAKGNARAAELAMLEDRVAMFNGRKQLYGSQIGIDQETGAYFLFPLEDPDRVDERRASVGLGPLASYLANWNLPWDVEAYKKQLPELERKIKEGK